MSLPTITIPRPFLAGLVHVAQALNAAVKSLILTKLASINPLEKLAIIALTNALGWFLQNAHDQLEQNRACPESKAPPAPNP
jgi:hypothetical protein